MKTLLLLFVFNFGSLHAQSLEYFCDQVGGNIVRAFKCPKSKLVLYSKICEFNSVDGKQQFFNGCSGPTGKFTAVFTKPCIKHDLCYHHEPVSKGLGQKDCDIQFYKNLLNACLEVHSEDVKSCIRRAKFMYRSLRTIGVFAFHCAESESKEYDLLFD